MTPVEIIEAYRRAYLLVTNLMRGLGRERGHPFKAFIVEARTRVRQAEHLLSLFRDAELQFKRHMQTPRPVDGSALTGWFMRQTELQDQIRLYGEAFYYFAWRTKRALASIPDLKLSFDPVGVRTVRNKLIEHPEQPGGAHILAWKFDCPEGLMLQPTRLGEPHLDRGLYPNAEEFIRKLLGKLETIPTQATAEQSADRHNSGRNTNSEKVVKATSDL